VLDRLRNNLGLKILSLAIALAGWSYLRLTPNPVIAARFEQPLSVPLETTGLRADEVAHYTEKAAVVTIEVPRGENAVRPDLVRAVLDLEGKGPGVYNVPIEVIAPKFDIRSLSPASVTLSVERIEERSLSVAVHYTGAVRRNVVVATPAILPGYATLRAPTSELRRVAGVRVDVPLPSAPSAFDAMLRPVAVDARGVELPSVDVSPNLVRVRARFGSPVAAARK
jgi:YbbR domain-containing protein